MCSAYYLSIPRSAAAVVSALGGDRRRLATTAATWIIVAYALVSGPLMVLNTIRFLTGAWVG